MSSVRNIDSNTFGDNAWIHQGDVIHHHAGNPHKPCVLIPFPRNEELIPRPDIISKLDELLPQSEEFFAAALYGLGGSGKTQIALDYAYRRSQVPTCSVFWVHADNETSFIQDFKLMAKRLGLPSNLDGDDLLMAVRYHIEANPPWVFILDNADNLTLFGVGHSAQDAMLGEHTSRLENFIPRGPRGQVLWTSRDERISGSIVGAQRAARVSNMTLDEARELFDSVRNKQASSAEAEAITALLAELDWLPLAISQSAAYIKKTMSTVEQYVSRLKEGKKRWKILKQSQTDRHRRREVSNSILETWNISMDYLRTENATSYQILHIHAFLDNQNIPVELIKQAALYSDESSVMDHGHKAYDDDSSSDSDSDGDTINEAIVRLCDFSFLSIQDAGDGNRAYKVHKLVQEAMRYGLGRKEREKEEKYFSAAALEIIFNLFPENEESKPELWDECEKYITHAQQACEWAAVCGRELTAASLFDKLSDYLLDRGRWREREIVDQRAYELRKATLGDNHTDTIASTARLAVTYSNLGRYKEAERIEVDVLAQRREILGDRHDDTIWSMERLAVTYNDLGRYKEAEELQLEALAVRREINGERHPDTIQSLVDLAATYYRLGRYEEAEQTHVQALALQREILGGRHFYTLKCMAGLGAVYHALGKYKEDKELSMEVLTLRQEILGEEHPDTIRSIAELGVTLRELGRFKKAEEMQVKALALRREILGEKHPDTIASMVDLAATYYSLYKYEEDERLSAEALALQREILGDDHPDTMDNMEKLAMTYRALRRDEEADELEMELSELQGS